MKRTAQEFPSPAVRRQNVAVVFPLDLGTIERQSPYQFKTISSSHGILRGVCQFARAHNEWNLSFSENDPSGLRRFLTKWKPHGIIAHVSTPEIKSILKESGARVVNVSCYLTDPEVPSIVVDNLAIGRFAAAHLLERGLRKFAFIGYPGIHFSEKRKEGFVTELQKAGKSVQYFPPTTAGEYEQGYTAENRELCRWLGSMTQPVGIFCCNDTLASNIASICRTINIRIPETVSILGADNSEIICELSHPPVSSVRIAHERIGYLAAEMLHGAMNGQTLSTEPVFIPPNGVAARSSTDVLGVDDPYLLQALKFIREKFQGSIGVEDILHSIPISRRTLEKKFQKHLNKSPLDEIIRVRLEHAKQLLMETDQTLERIARSSGFSNRENFSVVFKQKMAIPPGQFRERSRLGKRSIARDIMHTPKAVLSDGAA